MFLLFCCKCLLVCLDQTLIGSCRDFEAALKLTSGPSTRWTPLKSLWRNPGVCSSKTFISFPLKKETNEHQQFFSSTTEQRDMKTRHVLFMNVH